MTREEIQKVLELHRKWLNNEDGGASADLRSADLIGADLRDADLRGADLRGAKFEDTNLRYANLRYANLEGADLRGADLRSANLRSANLRGADLRGADLRGANLRGAIGNNKEVKTLQLGRYNITILVGIKIHISCQCHTVERWEKFTDEEISDMDNGALEWWSKWKHFILMVAKGE